MRSKINSKKRLIIGSVAWGEKYIENLFNVSFKSIFKSKDIEYISSNYRLHLVIVTNEDSIDLIKSLSDKIDKKIDFTLEIIMLDSINRSQRLKKLDSKFYDKYQIHSLATQKILEVTGKNDYLILNYSDFIWSSASLNNILDLLSNNSIDVISCHPLTLNDSSEDVIYFLEGMEGYEVTERQIQDLSLRNSEWWYNQYEWGNSKGSDYTSLMYFPVENSGYIFRGFHIHPIAFKGTNQHGKVLPKLHFGTVDGIYLPRILQAEGWINHFVEDQRTVCIGALSNQKSASYPGEVRNYVKKLESHIYKTHTKIETQNAFFSTFIGYEKFLPDKIDRVIDMSRQNLEHILDNVQTTNAERDYKYLRNQRNLYEFLENIHEVRFRIFLFSQYILKMILFALISPLLLFIRIGFRSKRSLKNFLRIIHHTFSKLKIQILRAVQKYLKSTEILINYHPVSKKELSTSQNIDVFIVERSQKFIFKTFVKVYVEKFFSNHRRRKYNWKTKN